MMKYLEMQLEYIKPWMMWIHLVLAVGLAKLWDQLGFMIGGESMAISGTSVIIIAILLGILHEVKYQTAVMDIHWSQDHEEMTEIKYELTEIKSEVSYSET